MTRDIYRLRTEGPLTVEHTDTTAGQEGTRADGARGAVDLQLDDLRPDWAAGWHDAWTSQADRRGA